MASLLLSTLHVNGRTVELEKKASNDELARAMIKVKLVKNQYCYRYEMILQIISQFARVRWYRIPRQRRHSHIRMLDAASCSCVNTKVLDACVIQHLKAADEKDNPHH